MPADSATVDVQGNETRAVAFTHAFGAEGTYTLAVDGVSAGTVEVVEQAGNATDDSGD